MSDEPIAAAETVAEYALRVELVAANADLMVKREARETLDREINTLGDDVAKKTIRLIKISKPFRNIVFRAQNSADVESGEEIARNYESVCPSSEELKAVICGALGQPYRGAGSWYIFDLPDLSGRKAAKISFGSGASYFLVSLELGTLATAKLLLEEYGIDLSVPDELRLLEERRADLASALAAIEGRIAGLRKEPEDA